MMFNPFKGTPKVHPKLCIIIGHNQTAQGAVRIDTGETEYSFNTRLARMISEECSRHNIDCHLIHRLKSPHGSKKEISLAYDQADEWIGDNDKSAVMELHFNSHHTPSANGCEMISSGSYKSNRLAHLLHDNIFDAFKLRDRGVKVPKKRGLHNVTTGKAPAVLLEPFFGSSTRDCKKFETDAHMEMLAVLIVASFELYTDELK